MTEHKRLYPNSDEQARLRGLYPDIGFVPSVDLYAPRETRSREVTKEEIENFIAYAKFVNEQD